MKILKKTIFVGLILILISSIYFVSPLPFRFDPTHMIVRQVNCMSCHNQELEDLKLGIHIRPMSFSQNRTLFDYVDLYGVSNVAAYKNIVAPCYTCHVAYKNYNLFGLTDPYVYPAGNYAYTIGNIAVSGPVYSAQYGTIIQWPYPYTNITAIQSNSTNETVTAELNLISLDPPDSLVTSTMTIHFQNYAGQQTGNNDYGYSQVLIPGETQTVTASGMAGDYFNITILLEGTWTSAVLNLTVTGTDKGTQSFDINANNPPVAYNIPKDFGGGNYLKTNGSYNAVRLDAIWNMWTNYPVNGNITSSDMVQTSSSSGWVNSTSCSAPDGMCHIIQKATSIGMSDGADPDKTFYNHGMDYVTSKQCRVCHLDSQMVPADTPTPTPTPTDTSTPIATPTDTSTPTPTDTSTSTPTDTSTPTSTPTPPDTPTP